MNEQTLIALEQSICKWNDICMGDKEENGVADCALCELFFDLGCNGCPIAEKTVRRECAKTPYDEWYDGLYSFKKITDVYFDILGFELSANSDKQAIINTRNNMVDIAEKELLFLLDLLPNNHPWREQI